VHGRGNACAPPPTARAPAAQNTSTETLDVEDLDAVYRRPVDQERSLIHGVKGDSGATKRRHLSTATMCYGDAHG
jgi:hypothetical protein